MSRLQAARWPSNNSTSCCPTAAASTAYPRSTSTRSSPGFTSATRESSLIRSAELGCGCRCVTRTGRTAFNTLPLHPATRRDDDNSVACRAARTQGGLVFWCLRCHRGQSDSLLLSTDCVPGIAAPTSMLQLAGGCCVTASNNNNKSRIWRHYRFLIQFKEDKRAWIEMWRMHTKSCFPPVSPSIISITSPSSRSHSEPGCRGSTSIPSTWCSWSSSTSGNKQNYKQTNKQTNRGGRLMRSCRTKRRTWIWRWGKAEFTAQVKSVSRTEEAVLMVGVFQRKEKIKKK